MATCVRFVLPMPSFFSAFSGFFRPFSKAIRRPWHPLVLLLVLALWLTTLGNLPLWRSLWALTDSHGLRTGLGLLGMGVIVFTATTVLLSLLVWPLWRKPVGVVLLMVAAANSYFMAAYGVVIDPSMMANTVQTDVREVRDLLSGSMGLVLLLGVVLPGVWWWRQPVQQWPAMRLLGRQLGLALLALVLMMVVIWASFQDLASTMRNHKSLRYMVNPFNTVYASGRLLVGQTTQARMSLQPIGEDAAVVSSGAAGAPPLIVLVVGETVRAANFGLAGYARDTTPQLRQLQTSGELTYFSNVRSCGTNTQVSVPCMFSHLGREAQAKNDIPYENLLDVLQRAGMQVLWLDNQSGCKGVCDRVPNFSTLTLKDPKLCPDGECFDEIMLRVLPERLAELEKTRPAGKAQVGTVVVLHQMGNHGPAYYKRTPADMKLYQPECRTNVLQDCPAQDIVNAYDNAVHYTDHFLGQTVRWLKTQPRPTAMLYVSDHGESLGEKGLYLHGMPYMMAPQEQTHVPMALWMSKSLQTQRGWDGACLQKQSIQALSHDHYFHSVLSLAQVKTRWQKTELDFLAACKRPAA
ncbi:MAG: phosphoethanolamine--lipid A transferase [Limnohabitans sp.]|uniref:phosphoethanolamine transferase n=1 Tax=Limnohabitans sp. TaxID=1907725 RepID=UPI0025DC010F|nr:phosphoethanolamine--lipid A transferase [Limnohabitans sp.]MCO4088096.1 phosphoethanolamine--lipid A transferase [Limnohabitans sp.]